VNFRKGAVRKTIRGRLKQLLGEIDYCKVAVRKAIRVSYGQILVR
jgi:hypothetical protein